MDWKENHKLAFDAARHVCGLESGVRAMMKVVGVIVALVIIWTTGGPNQAWNELGTKLAGTVAILLIFPVAYLWYLFDATTFIRRRATMLMVTIAVLLLVIGTVALSVGLSRVLAQRDPISIPESVSTALAAIPGLAKQIEGLSKKLEESKTTTLSATPETPSKPRHTGYNIRVHLEAIDGMLKFIRNDITDVMYSGARLTDHSQLKRHLADQTFAQAFKDVREKASRVFGEFNEKVNATRELPEVHEIVRAKGGGLQVVWWIWDFAEKLGTLADEMNRAHLADSARAWSLIENHVVLAQYRQSQNQLSNWITEKGNELTDLRKKWAAAEVLAE